jgi:hypothetical protein
MTIALFLASLAVAAGTGILLLRLLAPDLPAGGMGLTLRIAAGGGLGVGIASCSQFIALLAGGARLVIAFDLLLLLILGLLGRRLSGRRAPGAAGPVAVPAPAGPTAAWLPRLTAALFALAFAASLLNFTLATLREPYGRWDAWLIWNMHARFLYRGGEAWREAFASGLDWSHWDYPLLLPLSIARGWTYMGAEDTLLPALLGLFFTLAIVGLIAGGIGLLKDRVPGWLAGMILLGTPFFIAMGAAQFADIPLGFFMLLTIVLLALGSRQAPGGGGAFALAGLSAGLAAWTKNEGLLFVAVAVGALGITALARSPRGPGLRKAAWFVCGALPALLIVAAFKATLAPANDLVAGFSPATLADRLFDPGRHAEIVRAFGLTALSFTQGIVDIRRGMRPNPGAVSILLPVAYLALARIRIDRRDIAGLRLASLILGLMLAGYYLVYVLTPLDLNYHLVTSLNRLFIQLWPGFLFAIFLAAGTGQGGADRAGGLPAGPAGQSGKVGKQRGAFRAASRPGRPGKG